MPSTIRPCLVPLGTFLIAVLLSLVGGASGAFSLRAPGHPTGFESCSINCNGSATAPVLGYRETDVHLMAGLGVEELVVLPEEVRIAVMPTLEHNHRQLTKLLNCQKADLLPADLKIPYASVLTTNMGPSIWGYARGTAQLSVSNDRLGRPQGVALTQTRTAGANQGPLSQTTSGKLQHSLKMEGTGSPTSFGAVYALVSSDSVIRDYQKNAKAIAVLRAALALILALIPGNPIRGELIGDTVAGAFDHAAKIEQSAGFDLTARLNGSEVSGGTDSSVALVVGDDAEVHLRQVKRGKFYVVKLADPEDRADENVALEASARASALATGFRADAISALGDLWGYVTLLCCHSKNGDGDVKLGFASDNAMFDLHELRDPATQSRLPHLHQHQIISKMFLETYKAGIAEAGKLVDAEDCQGAKTRLIALHADLSRILSPKEKKDPHEPKDKRDKR